MTLIIAPFVRANEIGPILRVLLPLLGLVFVWAIVAKMPIQRYVFDRVAQCLVRTRWHFWRRFEDRLPLKDVLSLRQQADLTDSSSTTYYLVLDYQTTGGDVRSERLSPSSSGTRYDSLLKEISDWLSDD